MNTFSTIDFEDLIRYAIAIVVIFGTLAMVIYSIWGGFLMILSGGNEEKVKAAVNHIRHAIIGVFFLMLVLFVSPLLMRLIGIPYPEYATPRVIFSTISEISARIFDVNLDSGSIPLVPKNDVGTSDFSNL